MKPVSKAIIYDSSCPMCQAYTKGFVKWGILAEEHRIAFCELESDQALRYMDLQRSKHEIPLVDLAGGETLYGIDTLSYLLSQRIPVISKCLQYKPMAAFIKKLYSFISYNRRVITATSSESTGIDCNPDFHYRYRLSFIVFAILTASLISWQLGIAASKYEASLNGLNMLLVCGSGWVIQLLVTMMLLKGHQKTEYAGQLAVLMLMGTLVLLPGLVIDSITHHSHTAWLWGSVSISSLLMHFEHFRRIRYLKLNLVWLLLWSVALFSTALYWLWLFVK